MQQSTVYLVLKSMHILAVVLFLGNIITGAFWKSHADRTGDPKIIAHTLDGIRRSDRWFTLPGTLLIFIFGMSAATLAEVPVMSTSWIWQSLVLFGISGAAFTFQVTPLQTRMRAMAADGLAGRGWDGDEYRRLSRRWMFWGMVATFTPIGALVLMVMKPGA